jgi:hypothetical protein
MFLAQSRRAGRNGGASNKRTTPPASYLHRPSAKRNDPSFDHLVGAGEQHRGHLEAERSRRFEVDDQLVLRWRLHRQIGWLLAFQDAVDVTRRAPNLAATTLMTSSYLVGISTGKSPGFAPLRMGAT